MSNKIDYKYGRTKCKKYVKTSKLEYERELYREIQNKYITIYKHVIPSKSKTKVNRHMLFDLMYYSILTKVKRLKYKSDESIFTEKVNLILYDYFLLAEAITGSIDLEDKFNKRKYEIDFLDHISNLFNKKGNGRKYSLNKHAIMESFVKFPKYKCSPGSEKFLLINEAVKQHRRKHT